MTTPWNIAGHHPHPRLDPRLDLRLVHRKVCIDSSEEHVAKGLIVSQRRRSNRSFASRMDGERLEKACYRGDMEAIEEMYSMVTPLEFALYARDGRFLESALDGGQWEVAKFLLSKHFHVSNEAVAKAGYGPPELLKKVVESAPRQGLAGALSFAALAGSEENIRMILDSQKSYLNGALGTALS